MSPIRSRHKLALLAATGVAAWVLALAPWVPAQPPETAAAGAEYTVLADYGRLLSTCVLTDYAMAMYQFALDQTADKANTLFDARLRIEAEAVIFAFRNKQPLAARPLLDSVRDKVSLASTPVLRCVANLAVGYGSLSNRFFPDARSRAEDAFRAAQEARRPDLQADALVLVGRIQMEEQHLTDAMKNAQQALQLFGQARKQIEQSEAHILIAECHTAANNPAAAAISNQRARDVINDLTEGPVLNLQESVRLAPELLRNHAESARLGNYHKAFNEILTLLILNKFQFSMARQDPALKNLNLSESVLLAYAAHYAYLKGDALPSRVFVQLAEAAIPKETVARNKAEYLYLLGKYWRMVGDPTEAMRQFEKADQAVQALPFADAGLKTGLLEEKGLALVQMGHRDPGIQMLTAGLEDARKSGSPQTKERFEFYLALLRKEGEVDMQAISGRPDSFAAAMRHFQRERAGQNSAPLFRSPVVADYPPGAVRSAADTVLEIRVPRPVSASAVDVNPDPYMRTGLWEKAISILEAAIEEQGETPEKLQKLGECHYNIAQLDKAEKLFQRVLELDPTNKRAATYLQSIKSRKK